MKQRNDTGYEQNVMAWPSPEHPDHAPFLVGAGEEIDFPYLIGGFTLLDEPPVELPAESEPKAKRKDATAVADTKEGEPQ